MSTSNDAAIGPLEAFWRFRTWTVPITLVVGVLAGLAALATSGASTAETTLYLTDPRGAPVFRDGSSNPTDLVRFAQQRANFAQSATIRGEVLAAVADAPGAEDLTADELDDAIEALPTPSSDVRVTCTDDDAELALSICEEVVTSYIELSTADTNNRADATVNALTIERERLIASGQADAAVLNNIDLRIAEIRSEAALFASGLEFIDPPELIPSSRIRPAVQFGIAGLLFAAFATAALAWFRAGRRPLLGTSAEAGSLLRAPVLGELVHLDGDQFHPASPPGAEYQFLATSVGAVRPDGGVILAATPRPHPRMAESVARLAVAAAREGRRVLVVDGNLHDRSVSSLFGIERGALGLTETLAGLTSVDEVVQSVGVGGEAAVDIIGGGRSVDDPASLFRSQQARSILRSLHDAYELVLIDVPPMLTAADGAALASGTDGALLFIERGAERTDLETVRQRLGVLRVPLVGVVFDRRPHDQQR